MRAPNISNYYIKTTFIKQSRDSLYFSTAYASATVTCYINTLTETIKPNTTVSSKPATSSKHHTSLLSTMPPTTRSATRKVLTAPANPSTLQQEATHISPSNPPSEPCYLVDKMPVEVLEMICNFFYRGVKARREVRKKSEEPADPIEPSQNTSLLRTCKQTNAIAGKSMRNHVTLQIDNIQHMLQILRPMSKEHASQLRYMEINSRVIQLWYGVKTQDTSNWDRFLKCTEMLNLEWLVIDNVEHSFGRPRGKKDSHHPVLAHVPSQWKTSYILWDKWTSTSPCKF
jgi:hypothetical protein